MNIYLRHLIGYFEYVLHPSAAWSSDSNTVKRKRKATRPSQQVSPDNFNIRGDKGGDKKRRNPAP